MTLNPLTKKFELPPPRWFNKATGEYEDIKPMYFVDESNPELGFVPANRIVREDDAFRQFLQDKEKKRRLRVERERQDLERQKLESLNPSPAAADSPDTKPTRPKKARTTTEGLEFDEELAQKEFREVTGRMMSKRGASKFTGPSTKEDKARKMEEKYSALKPLAPISDADIQELPAAINEEEIIQAWRNSPAIRAPPKSQKPVKTEAERARALMKSRTGLKTGWMFSASRGSYRPPSTIATINNGTNRWTEEAEQAPTLLGQETEVIESAQKKLRGWRIGELESKAWWEGRNTTLPPRMAEQWRERNKLREQKGRIALNPVTGKLEDLAPVKVDVRNYSVPGNLMACDSNVADSRWIPTVYEGPSLIEKDGTYLWSFRIFC
jgi:hypothetical protein